MHIFVNMYNLELFVRNLFALTKSCHDANINVVLDVYKTYMSDVASVCETCWERLYDTAKKN